MALLGWLGVGECVCGRLKGVVVLDVEVCGVHAQTDGDQMQKGQLPAGVGGGLFADGDEGELKASRRLSPDSDGLI